MLKGMFASNEDWVRSHFSLICPKSDRKKKELLISGFYPEDGFDLLRNASATAEARCVFHGVKPCLSSGFTAQTNLALRDLKKRE